MSKSTDALPPVPFETDPELRSSYDVRKLYYMKTKLSDGKTTEMLETVRNFCRAYHDGDIEALLELMNSDAHFGTFWGVVRGPLSINIAFQEEQKYRIAFTTSLRVVTSHTFERDGYVQRRDAIGPWKAYHKMRRYALRESFVVDEQTGKIRFRQLHLKAGYHF